MASLSIKVSDDMIKKMENFPNINWEDFMTKILSEYLDMLTKSDKMVENSEFTSLDAEELGEMVKKTAWNTFKEKYEIK